LLPAPDPLCCVAFGLSRQPEQAKAFVQRAFHGAVRVLSPSGGRHFRAWLVAACLDRS